MRALQFAAFIVLVGAAAASLSTSADEVEVGTLYYTNATDPSAVCLDGSSGAFYHWSATNPAYANRWVIYLQGGGACNSPEQCYERSKTPLGSSKFAPPTASSALLKGAMSRNCTLNPEFCQYNLVTVAYCDGYLWSGERDVPLVYNNTNLYLRGGPIRRAVYTTLAQEVPAFTAATDVLLVGCSAGGYGTILHLDDSVARVRAVAPNVQRLKAAPFSGLFLEQPNVQGIDGFKFGAQKMAPIANYTPGLSKRCTASLPESMKWMCVFGEVVLASLGQVPLFVINSKTDLWQITCILLGSTSSSNSCMGALNYAQTQCALANFTSCTLEQFFPIDSYAQAFLNRVADIDTFKRDGNGAFISSCYTHCEAMFDEMWGGVIIDGVSLQQATLAWWQDLVPAPALTRTSIDCTRPLASPYTCNPTCPVRTTPAPWVHVGNLTHDDVEAADGAGFVSAWRL